MLRYDLGAMLWLWCWRCKAEMPMLDEAEFKAVIQGFYPHDLEKYKLGWPEVRAEFTRITGYVETNPNAIWHHRTSLYGPPCHRCGKPLRSPKAKLCGSCMAPRGAKLRRGQKPSYFRFAVSLDRKRLGHKTALTPES
jgi:ribosomal protein L37E